MCFFIGFLFGAKAATILLFLCVTVTTLQLGATAGIFAALTTIIFNVLYIDPRFQSLTRAVIDTFVMIATASVLIWQAQAYRASKRDQRRVSLRAQKSERNFKEAEERFHSALAAAHAGIYRLDLKFGTAFRNASLNKIFGLMDKEAVFPINDFKMRIHADDQERVNQAIGRMIQMKSSFSEQYRVYRADGSILWIKDRGTVILDDAGEVEAVTGTMVDITDLVQAEESLHRSQEQFRVLIESIKDYGLFLLDLKGNIISWNVGAERITGFSDCEAIGEHLSTIFATTLTTDLPDRTRSELKEAREKGIWQGERWHARKNGTYFLAQELVYPLQRSGEVYGYAKVMNDITLRKKAEESLRHSEARFRQLLEAIPQMVFTATPKYNFDFANQRWLDYTGLSQTQITREGWSTLFDPAEVSDTTQIWKAAADSKSAFSHELRIRRADGSYRWHLCRAFPILDANGHISEWFGTHTDIEEQKQLQNELLRAKQEAEEVSQMKSAFLATVSHEIRTPLSAIIGFSRLLVEETWPEEKMKEFAQISLRNGYALSRIIDDILDLSKVEAGKLEITKSDVSMQELLSEVVESLSVKAMEKGIGVSYRIEDTVPETFLSDAVRLRQILINIIGNAIKFTVEGDVQVSVQAEQKDIGKTLAIYVKDTGCGISEQSAQNLFQPFQQADTSTSRKYGGTGLGLALSRKLSQLLGGNVILLHSAPSEGSTFMVELPLLDKAPQVKRVTKRVEGATPALPMRARLTGMRILVAEDAVDTQLLIRQILQRQGAEIDFADNGQQAIERAESKDYDIILMDIQMPVCDGYQATRTLRSRAFAKPIIGLSAHAMREEHEKIIASGCNEHLAKPFDPKKLVDLIEMLGARSTESIEA
ncbi:MAG: PAS domain-containing sensor histidine kinase [Proteobacteria bacterium]|nr:MAG: PAS domain-containing sensor histidine kinase [Pseudomonadota bacterium]